MPTTVYNRSEADKFVTGTSVDLVVVKCTCGLLFAIPENLNRSALNHRGPKGWQISCPLGHTWHYTGDDIEERLRRELEQERDRTARLRANLDQSEASLRTTKGHVTRKKKQLERVKNGVCPCCGRTFQNLGRHMQTKHPEFKP